TSDLPQHASSISFPMSVCVTTLCLLFFFSDPATIEISTLSLHDALPISASARCGAPPRHPYRAPARDGARGWAAAGPAARTAPRSEEHTSELQSHLNLVCRLLLEKKKKKTKTHTKTIQQN